jgi:uncharacterized protein (TIGR03437 family)
MERNRKLYLAKAAVIMGAIPFLLWAYAEGPDAGKAGVPGESNCTEAGCHVGTLNPTGFGGSVKVGLPGAATYTPGVKQHLVVTIADGTAKNWGFELTARLASDPKTQAGSFTSTDAFTAVVCGVPSLDIVQEVFLDFGKSQTCPAAKPLAYVEHTLSGSSRIKTGSMTYEFDWTPPATAVGNITIYVAGNAANADGNNTGDHIYTSNVTLSAAGAGGGPSITPNGVVSAGAFGGFTSVAPGSWMEIFGSNLSSTTRGWAGADFVGTKAPTSLDNVKVTIGGQDAFIDFVSPGQINAQVPSNTPTGAQQMTVTNASGTSSSYAITVNPLQPGLLAPPTFLVGGKQYLVAQFSDGSFVLPPNAIAGVASRQAKPGETIVIYGVGFGPVLDSGNQNIPAGNIVTAANKLSNSLAMSFGGTAATLSYFGLAPNFVGLYQFNVVVPNVANSDLVPLTFQLNGAAGTQTLFTAVHN